MKKEEEIKIIEQIKLLIAKLLKARNGYIKKFIGPYINPDELDKISKNIKNDFPPLLNTKIEVDLSRLTDIYKQRLVISHYLQYITREQLKSCDIRICDLGNDLKTVYLREGGFMQLFLLYQANIIDVTEFCGRVKSLYSPEIILEKKIDLNIELTIKEKSILKGIIQNQTQTKLLL